MRFIFNVVAYALVCAFAFFLILAVGCGGEPADLFPERPATDAGTEIGSAEQGLSTKFSSLYTHGLSTATTAKKAMVSLGCGSGQICVLPGYGTVRFKITGTDPHEGNLTYSWKGQIKRAITDSFKNSAKSSGFSWPFSAIEDNTSAAWVEATSGNCPGDGLGNDITEVACLQWTMGSSPTVTEAFVGTYKRFTGTLKIIFDNEAIVNQCDLRNCDQADLHELIEHAAHAVGPAVYGSGIYLSDQPNGYSGNLSSWSSPNMFQSDSRRFTRSEYTIGELCRAGNWNNTAIGEFTQATGSCGN